MVYRSKTPRMRLESHPLDAPSEELDGERGDSALSSRIAGIRYLTLRGSYFLASVLWDIPARTRDDLRLNQRRSALRRGDRSQHRRPARSRGHHARRAPEVAPGLRPRASEDARHGAEAAYWHRARQPRRSPSKQTNSESKSSLEHKNKTKKKFRTRSSRSFALSGQVTQPALA